MARNDVTFSIGADPNPLQSDLTEAERMIQNFADLAISGDRQTRADCVAAATTTQYYLDTVWAAPVIRL